MRTRNALDRLAAAGGPLLAEADSLVDAGEEERILERILVAPRPAASRLRPARLRIALAGVAVLAAAAIAASLEIGHPAAPRPTGNRHLALSGVKLQLAGYRFRTPAGFTASPTACGSLDRTGQSTMMQGFATAASADGGCIGAFVLISSSGSAVQADATPVDVGAYQGYITAADSAQGMTLYVVLPTLGGQINWQAVELHSQGLTSDQLIAIAQSGLPATPSPTVG